MKKEGLWYTLAGIAVMGIIFGTLWLCASSETLDRVSVTKIPETDLTVIRTDRDYVGLDDATVISYYTLVNEGDTLAEGFYNVDPFINVKGIVYIPKQGVYDCRKHHVKRILAFEGEMDLTMTRMRGDIVIVVGHPFWNINTMAWDDSKVRKYVYNLHTNRFVSL